MKKIFLHCVITLFVVSLAVGMSACGSTGGTSLSARPQGSPGGSGSGGTSAGGSGTITATPGAAQGVYSGKCCDSTLKPTFYAIILPNDMYYSIDGEMAADGSMAQLYEFNTGQGSSNDGKYTARPTRYVWNNDAVLATTVTATYVPGASLTGSTTILSNGYTRIFEATALPSSILDFNAAANLTHIVGLWQGWFATDPMVGDGAGSISISSDGAFTIAGDNCTSGTITPDASNKNFFAVKLTAGPAPCPAAGQTGTGIAVEMLLPNGTRQLLLGAVLGGNSLEFAAQR